jgi:predicted branched-subunit amino acid permease
MQSEPPPPVTWGGIVHGMKVMMPFYIPVSVFGAAVGAVAAQKGLSLVELSVMNFAVYGGMAQLVALGFWQESWNLTALLSIALTTLAINGRLLLMSASLRPWFAAAPARVVYPSLLTMTDANYIAGQAYYERGGRDIGMFIGAGGVLWVMWVITPIPGYLLGSLIADPRTVGLDLVMPIIFAAMIARVWKGTRDTLSMVAAGLVGFAVERMLGGSLHVVIGALAGMAVAAIYGFPLRPRPEPPGGEGAP